MRIIAGDWPAEIKKNCKLGFLYGPTEYLWEVSGNLYENCETSSILKSKNEIVR